MLWALSSPSFQDRVSDVSSIASVTLPVNSRTSKAYTECPLPVVVIDDQFDLSKVCS